MTVRTLRRCLSALIVDIDFTVRGDRAGYERLADERHAGLETVWARTLRGRGWQVWPEHSFSHFGERGRVDLLCWHPATRTLAVVEIKTEIADSQALLGVLDAKVRLGTVMARQLGLPPPASVVPILILAASMTNRRRVAQLAPLFERFDVRGPVARAWLRRPSGVDGVLFFSGANPMRARERTQHRVRLRGQPPRVD
jgi:hypothetical protein